MANGSFGDVVGKMPGYLHTLKSQEFAPGDDENFPSGLLNVPGIYCFYEGDKPMYVGRSQTVRDRVLEHRRLGGNHFTASFAFNIAKKEFGLDRASRYKTRKCLQKDPEFANLFEAAKARVRKMSVRFVKIEDPIEQTIFEVYAHMELGTSPRFNSFENH